MDILGLKQLYIQAAEPIPGDHYIYIVSEQTKQNNLYNIKLNYNLTKLTQT